MGRHQPLRGFGSLLIGIVTAALDVTLLKGFEALYWFLIAVFAFMLVLCTELLLLRMHFEGKKDT